MKRGDFLKLVATLVVAPTILGDVVIKPHDEKKNNKIFGGDRIRIFTKDNYVRVGDIIRSDLGSTGYVITKGIDFIEIKNVTPTEYKYQDLRQFRVFANAFAEKSYT